MPHWFALFLLAPMLLATGCDDARLRVAQAIAPATNTPLPTATPLPAPTAAPTVAAFQTRALTAGPRNPHREFIQGNAGQTLEGFITIQGAGRDIVFGNYPLTSRTPTGTMSLPGSPEQAGAAGNENGNY